MVLYLNRVGHSMITSSHVAVVLGDGGADIQVTVLAVHVVGSGPLINISSFLIAEHKIIEGRSKSLALLFQQH